MTNLITADQMKKLTVKIHEPFAEFLEASREEHQFELSLLDVVRFAGHACPSMVGAFVISQHAIRTLFPETLACERGQVAIELPHGPEDGATGPVANVFSFIFGAWEESGFGGLGGDRFVRRNLLRFRSPGVPNGAFRFRRIDTGKTIDVFYDPRKANVKVDPDWPFQKQWRARISRIAEHPEEVVW